MASELYYIDGEASIAYTGETPWHRLGQKLEEGESIEVWAEKAHLNWPILETPAFYNAGGNNVQIPKKKTLIRGDNNDFLSIVGEKYQTVQPIEVLEFFRDLVASGGFKLSTAGSIFNGLKMWALAETGEPLNIAGDLVKQYLLLATGCDGAFANTGMFTTTRVVCNNTLNISIREGESGESRKYVKIPHSTKFNPEMMKAELGLGQQSFAHFADSANEMTKFRMSDKDAVKIFTGLITKEDGNEQEKGTQRRTVFPFIRPTNKTVANIFDFYKKGIGQDTPAANGTLWGVVNAVTGFVDHIRQAKNDDVRMNNALFGNGAVLKSMAWAVADDIIRKAA